MYRGRLWTMRQYAGLGDAEESNARYKFLLANGTAGLSVAFDLPTQMGYDSDDPMAVGEVGKVGVAIDSLEDMERLFDGIPLDRITTSMTINATAAILLALYVAVARRAGADTNKLSGTVQNDILKEYIARGTYIYPIRHAMRLMTDTFAWAAHNVPEWNTISISGYHMREAGSTAAQEVAFTLANGMTYVQAAIDAGLDVDAFAPRLSFFFNAHNDFFEEIAKFRCARRVWAGIMRDHFAAKNPRSWMLRFHTQTAGSTLTAQQPENNIVRTAIQALTAVLGGTQSLHTNGYDEALALPTEEAARIALRTQQILASESGVAQTVDPVARILLTSNRSPAKSNTRFVATSTAFTLWAACCTPSSTDGCSRKFRMPHSTISARVDSGEAVVVGVNRFTVESEVEIPIQRIDEDLERRQVERVRALRLRRDASAPRRFTRQGGQHARSGENLVPAILEAVESLATVGEIAGAMRSVFGEYQEAVVI